MPSAPPAPLEPPIESTIESTATFTRAVSVVGNGGWDNRKYLRKIFHNIDHNSDGAISLLELYRALKEGIMPSNR